MIVVVFLLLVLIASVEPHHSAYSNFERKRRLGEGGSKMERDALRHQAHSGVIAWLGIKEVVLAIGFVLLLLYAYGLGIGLIIGIFAIFAYKIIAQLPIVHRLAQKLYDNYELVILQSVQKLQPVTKLLRPAARRRETTVASREELIHVIDQSSRLVEQGEYELLKSALQFNELIIKDFMTPRESIDTVKVSELLGPLVLDDLHKTGHHQFPVIDPDIDHVVGVLDVEDLLMVGDKSSPHVRRAMDARVCYIRQSDKLESALTAFVKTKRHLLIVVDEAGATAGLLSLGDVIGALTGRVSDEAFDEYDNLQSVVGRIS